MDGCGVSDALGDLVLAGDDEVLVDLLLEAALLVGGHVEAQRGRHRDRRQ